MLKDKKVIPSFLQKWPFKRFLYRHFGPFAPIAFEQFRFEDYDLVVSLSAGAAKGIITGVNTTHVSLILTPPRYQWGGELNARASRFRGLYSVLAPSVDHYLRAWDFDASKRPNHLISISKFIQSRVKKYYRRDSEVIYPGVDLSNWFHDSEDKVPEEDFYFIASRLYDYKRIDLAVLACNHLRKNLVIMGSGPDERYLRRIAGPTVKFYPYQSDERVIRRYMSQAKAFLFPGVEDFGLTPVESMACGTPVIAYNLGGVTETVQDGVTGLFFDDQNPESLESAIKKFEKMKFDKKLIVSRGKEFSEENFISSFKKYMENI
jgi:glycosyltransferase involved in cell wall biosynthesis